MFFDPCITLSPRNYNALYRIISRLSFSLDPGGVSRCVPRRPGGVHLYALHRGNVAAACGVGGIYAAAWCSLAALNAARAANGKIYVSSSFPRNYINIFIYYAESEEDTHVLRFASKRTFRTQTGGMGRCVCRRACIRRRAVYCGGVRGVWLPAGRIRPHRQGPPLGHPVKERRHSPNFFLFFLKREGVSLIYR